MSTGRLSERAGIVQSGFYAHFGSVEECTLVAAERIGQRLRGLIVRKMSEEDTIDTGALAWFVEGMLGRLEGEWKFVELMLRYRRDPSPLGEVMSRFYEQVREDVVSNLIEVGPPVGIKQEDRLLLVPAAHSIVMQFVTALECIAGGWAPERKMLAKHLAAQIQLSARQGYEAIEEGSLDSLDALNAPES